MLAASIISGTSEITEHRPIMNLRLLDLPSELLQRTIDHMTQEDKFSMLRACRRTYDLTLPALYDSISTKRDTMNDLNALVILFTTKPGLTSLVRVLAIDELDPAAIRRLLAISFPKMIKLSIRHSGPIEKVITEDEKMILNQSIKRQPRLKDLVFSVMSGDLYCLTTNDYPLFNHPTLTSICCQSLDFHSWMDLPRSTFTHTRLDTLCLNDCSHPPYVLKLFTYSTKNLSQVRVWTWPSRRSRPKSLIESCLPRFQMLKVLKLAGSRRALGSAGLYLRELSSLVLLQVRLQVLLGPLYQPSSDDEVIYAENLLRPHIPPNLKALCLDHVLLTNPLPLPTNDADNTNDAGPTILARPSRHLLKPVDKSIIKALILHKTALFPNLFVIYTDYSYDRFHDTMTEVQDSDCIDPETDELFHLAEEKGVDVLRIACDDTESSETPKLRWIEGLRGPRYAGTDGTVHERERLGGAHGERYCSCYVSWHAWDGRQRTCEFEH